MATAGTSSHRGLGARASVVFTAIKNGLFGTVYVMQKKAHAMPTLTLTALGIKWLQMLSFILGPSEFHWSPAAMPAQVASLIFTAGGWFRLMEDPYVYLALFFVSFAWVATFIGLMGWALRAFGKGEVTSLWPIRLLAMIGSFSATVAFIPLTAILLSTFHCVGSPASSSSGSIGSTQAQPAAYDFETEMAIHAFAHEPFWAQAGFTCFQGSHLAITVVSTVLASLFVVVCSVFSLLVYDGHSLTPNLAGKAHGRVDFALLILKTVMVVIIDILPHKLGGASHDTEAAAMNMTIINIVAGLAWTALVWLYMPYTHHLMNRLSISIGCSLVSGSIVLAIQQSTYPWFDAAPVLYLSIPIAITLGFMLADRRKCTIICTPTSKLSSSFEVDMAVRYKLQEGLLACLALEKLGFQPAASAAATATLAQKLSAISANQESLRIQKLENDRRVRAASAAAAAATTITAAGESSVEHSSLSSSSGTTAVTDGHKIVASAPGTPTAGRGRSVAGSVRPSPTNRRRSAGGAESVAPPHAAIAMNGYGGSNVGYAPTAVPGSPLGAANHSSAASHHGAEVDLQMALAVFAAMEADERAAWVRKRLPKSVIEEAGAMYKAAVVRFPSSAFLHVFQARFYRDYDRESGSHQHMSHLVHAQRLQPALDVEYLAFAARRTLDSEGAMGAAGGSAVARVAFDKHLSDARSGMLHVLQMQMSFWTELMDSKPDIARMHALSSRIHGCIAETETHFQETFCLNSQSLPAMRLYAQYHLFMGDAEKSAATAAEAERIEDQKSNESSSGFGAAKSGDMGVSIIRAIAASTSLQHEMISDATATVTVGATARNLGMILHANAAACRMFGYSRLALERRNVSVLIPQPFADVHQMAMQRNLATGEGNILERVRVLMARHSSGYVFPVKIMVRASTASDGSHTFHALMRALPSPDQYLIMDGEWRITGASLGALDAMGLDAQTLVSVPIYLREFFPCVDEPGVMESMRQGLAASSTYSGTAAAAAASNSGGGEEGSGAKPGAAAGRRPGAVVQMYAPGISSYNDGSATSGGGGEEHEEEQTDFIPVRASLATMLSRVFTVHVLSWSPAMQPRPSAAASLAAQQQSRRGSDATLGAAATLDHTDQHQSVPAAFGSPRFLPSDAPAPVSRTMRTDRDYQMQHRRSSAGPVPASSVLRSGNNGVLGSARLMNGGRLQQPQQGMQPTRRSSLGLPPSAGRVSRLQLQDQLQQLSARGYASVGGGATSRDASCLNDGSGGGHSDRRRSGTPVTDPLQQRSGVRFSSHENDSLPLPAQPDRSAVGGIPPFTIGSGAVSQPIQGNDGLDHTMGSLRVSHEEAEEQQDEAASSSAASSSDTSAATPAHPEHHHGRRCATDLDHALVDHHSGSTAMDIVGQGSGCPFLAGSKCNAGTTTVSPLHIQHPPARGNESGSDGTPSEDRQQLHPRSSPAASPIGIRHHASRRSGDNVNSTRGAPARTKFDRDDRRRSDDRDERSSFASSSRMSMSKGTFMKLRRALAAQAGGGSGNGKHGRQLSPALRRLWYVGLILVALNISLAAVAAAVLDSSFASFSTHIRFATLSATATVAVFRALRIVQQRALYERGLFYTSHSDEVANSELLVGYSRDMSGAVQDMYDLSIGTAVESFFVDKDMRIASYTPTDTPIIAPPSSASITRYGNLSAAVEAIDQQYLDPYLGLVPESSVFWPYSHNGYVHMGKVTSQTLLQYAFTFELALQQIAKQDIVDPTQHGGVPINGTNFSSSAASSSSSFAAQQWSSRWNNPLMRSLVENCRPGGAVNRKMVHAIVKAHEVVQDTGQSVTDVSLYLFLAMGPALTLLLMSLVTPLLLSLEHNRDEVMERFLDLPVLILAALRGETERRLKALRADTDDDEGDEDGERGDVSIDVVANEVAMAFNADNGNGSDGDDDLGDGMDQVDWEVLFQRAAVEHVRAERKAHKHAVHEARMQQQTRQLPDPAVTRAALPVNGGYTSTKAAALGIEGLGSPSSRASTPGHRGSVVENPMTTANGAITSASQSAQKQQRGSAVVVFGEAPSYSSMPNPFESTMTSPVHQLAPAVPRARAHTEHDSAQTADAIGSSLPQQYSTAQPSKTSVAAPREGPGRLGSSALSHPLSTYLLTTLGCISTRYRPMLNPDGTHSSLTRTFRKGGRSMLKLCAFQLPVLIIFAFFLILYLTTESMLNQVVSLSAYTALANLRTTSSMSASVSVFMYLSILGYPSEQDRAFYIAQGSIDALEIMQAHLAYNDDEALATFDDPSAMAHYSDYALVTSIPMSKSTTHGSEMSGLQGISADLQAQVHSWMFIDACPLIIQVYPSWTDDSCSTFADGVLRHGLHQTTQDFIRRMREHEEQKRATDIPFNSTDGIGITRQNVADEVLETPYSTYDKYNDDTWKVVDIMRLKILLPAFKHIVTLYQQTALNAVDSYRSFLVVYVAAFTSVFTLAMLSLYLPAVRALGSDLHSKRSMLLLLPAQVIAMVPSLRSMVFAILVEADTGASASASLSAGTALRVPAKTNTVGAGDTGNDVDSPPTVRREGSRASRSPIGRARQGSSARSDNADAAYADVLTDRRS